MVILIDCTPQIVNLAEDAGLRGSCSIDNITISRTIKNLCELLIKSVLHRAIDL